MANSPVQRRGAQYPQVFDPMSTLRQSVERLFSELMPAPWSQGDQSQWRGGAAMPAMKVRQADDATVLELEIPGVDPKNIDVSVENGMLLIRAEQEEKNGDNQQSVYRRYERAISLPPEVQQEGIEATHRHGLLEIRIPQPAKSQARRIDVRRAGEESEGEQRTGNGGRNRQQVNVANAARNGATEAGSESSSNMGRA